MSYEDLRETGFAPEVEERDAVVEETKDLTYEAVIKFRVREGSLLLHEGERKVSSTITGIELGAEPRILRHRPKVEGTLLAGLKYIIKEFYEQK